MDAITSYDQVPYQSLPIPQTHPARLGAVARLFGVAPALPSRSRVLELGCAAGGNLLPMALAMPEARFVGIDLSRVQIEQGRELARRLGVGNLELIHLDLMQADASLGQFDYVIAHGLYSWVPGEVQDRVLALCRDVLAPEGLAYVSYNAMPGWHTRRVIRDLMRFHALQFKDPSERAAHARAILDFVSRESVVPNPLLRTEVELLLQQPDSYLLHEHLESDNAALYFHEFAARAGAAGLQYLAEAELGSMLSDGFSPEVKAVLDALTADPLRREQYMDFLRNRMFRQTLLVHADRPVRRAIDAAAVEGLWVGGPVHELPEAEAGAAPGSRTFSGSSGVNVTTASAFTQAALQVIGERFPAQVGFEELASEAARRARPYGTWVPGPADRTVLALDLVHCHAAGILELTSEPFVAAPLAAGAPRASELSRLQAGRNEPVSTMRHESVQLAPEFNRLLVLLDGSNDRDAILRNAPFLSGREQLDQALQIIAVSALLTA